MLPPVLQAAERQGYRVFTRGDLRLNLVAIRSEGRESNAFDDKLTLSFRRGGVWETHSWPVTTDPGLYWLHNPMNVAGTAKLIPGQYLDSHRIGRHRDQYEALVQVAPVAVWRDADGNGEHLGTVAERGMFGINIHKAGTDSPAVNKWSAGCVVFKREVDYDEFMGLVRESAMLWGDTVTLTLLEEHELNG